MLNKKYYLFILCFLISQSALIAQNWQPNYQGSGYTNQAGSEYPNAQNRRNLQFSDQQDYPNTNQSVDSRNQYPSQHNNQNIDFRDPTRSYEETGLGEWKVYIERPLARREPDLANRAIARLGTILNQAMAVLPPGTAEEFRNINFFLMYGPKSPLGGRTHGLDYHRPNDPDFCKQSDRRWRNCVVIYSADNLLSMTDFWALKVFVHELSHAHHLLHWPEKQPTIYKSWQNAMALGLYQNVQDSNGRIRPKAYAATNQLEYFAELSAIYFVGCDYYPFNREQLKSYDPMGYKMICKMWHIQN